MNTPKGFGLRFLPRWLGWRDPGSKESAARRDAVSYRIREARWFL